MNTKIPDLDTIISNIYGKTLRKYKNIKAAYSIFTPYKNIQTNQITYFYLFRASSKNHLSEGTINYALKKYNPFLSRVEFCQIQKHFDWTYYLIKSSNYLISIDELICLKKQCQQIMEKQCILKTIEFLISIYKSKKYAQFPELTPKSIGQNEEGQLKICDYEFYFKKQFQMRTLTENICSCVNPMIKIALLKSSSRIIPSEDEYERLKEYYGQNFARLIKIIVLDPLQNMQKEGVLNGKGKQVNIKKIQQALSNYYKSSDQDPNTTLNQTFDQDYKSQKQNVSKYRQSDLLTIESVKQPFLIKDDTKKQKKHKIIKFVAIFMILLVLTAGALLFLMYHSNQVNCDIGTFKSKDSNQCLSCSQGCLRCQSAQQGACFSCSSKMYLVLNDQNDSMGNCQSTCTGIILRSNLCIKKNKTS